MSIRLRRAGSVIAVALDRHFADRQINRDDRNSRKLRLLESPIVTRRVVAAQTALFREGDLAKSYFIVASGEMVICRRHRPHLKSAVSFVSAGDLFIYNCGSRHAATCHATLDTVVWAVDRHWLDAAAKNHDALTSVLQAMHASELSMILGSYSAPPARPGDRCEAPLNRRVQWNCIEALRHGTASRNFNR